MKTLIEALELVKELNIYDKHIIIALGVNKQATTLKEGFYFKRLEDKLKEIEK